MKILLQSEARQISKRELEKNQQYLIELYQRIYRLLTSFTFNRHQFDRRNSCK